MTFPVRLALGPVVVPLHLLCEVLAYTLSYQLYQRLRGRTQDRISDDHRLWIFVGAAVGALIGSRVLGLLEHPAQLLHLPGGWPYYFTNKTILGGLLGGLIGVETTKQRLGVTASSGDLMVYPLVLGMTIGRIGCFLSGLEDGTFGTVTALPWGINFGDGLRRHPTNLYEIGWLALTGLGLRALESRRALADGARFQLFMVSYCAFRLLVEFVKPALPWPAWLTPIQWAAVAGLLYYAWVWTRPTKRILVTNDATPEPISIR